MKFSQTNGLGGDCKKTDVHTHGHIKKHVCKNEIDPNNGIGSISKKTYINIHSKPQTQPTL